MDYKVSKSSNDDSSFITISRTLDKKIFELLDSSVRFGSGFQRKCSNLEERESKMWNAFHSLELYISNIENGKVK